MISNVTDSTPLKSIHYVRPDRNYQPRIYPKRGYQSANRASNICGTSILLCTEHHVRYICLWNIANEALKWTWFSISFRYQSVGLGESAAHIGYSIKVLSWKKEYAMLYTLQGSWSVSNASHVNETQAKRSLQLSTFGINAIREKMTHQYSITAQNPWIIIFWDLTWESFTPSA